MKSYKIEVAFLLTEVVSKNSKDIRYVDYDKIKNQLPGVKYIQIVKSTQLYGRLYFTICFECEERNFNFLILKHPSLSIISQRKIS
jgi:hypothetical protein